MARWTEYDSVPRRRARAVRRLATALMEPKVYPLARVVPAFWWDGHANFGDALTPWLLPKYGIVPVLTTPGRARLAGIGSILEQLPPDFSGAVFGSGLLRGRPVRLPKARFVAVRGPLTRHLLGIDVPVALGDPGLLVGRHSRRSHERWTLGVVPHGIHQGNRDVGALVARYPREVNLIDVARPPSLVLRDIARCGAVLSTSLHGLIVADAFGIPAAWARLDPDLWGSDFKFRDHEAVVTPGRSRQTVLGPDTQLKSALDATSRAEPDLVSAAVADLEHALLTLDGTRDLAVLALRHR